MIDRLIKIILILLLVFTPIAFGSMELWALTVMEFGILAMIALYVIGEMFSKGEPRKEQPSASDVSADPKNTKRGSYLLPIFLLCLFLALILFQMVPLPPGALENPLPENL